ncbi:hypothetical protein DVB69_01785 [Sporosarcina sp. BI001-red]|uniref:hypothetical protein n=1 Tax=Sporosarcina sp. BI001-red TaxID=2282866 RepID=UPI000E262571|nr:hypothetical protein [Sporosarcina sp. BI001-red]REB09566.1 hypothetical protein DVB69_01785 [Sporosarcina sp. BI001-red]
MTIRKILLLGFILVLLAGCSTSIGFKTVNTTDVDGQRAETLVKEDKRIKNAVILIHDDRLIAGLRVNTFERFKKRKIAKELSKELEKLYPEMKITVSADSKVLLETNKLIDEKNEKNYAKKMKKISSLVKEET